MADLNKFQEIIDSRDVIERLKELTEIGDAHLGVEEAAELAFLTLFAAEFKDYAPDYEYGEMAIRDSHFKEYAQDLAEDIGAIDPNAAWPNDCIDWDLAVRELQTDYTQIKFDNVSYWVR
jgi:hypothetical protein